MIGAREFGLLGVHVVIVLRIMKGVYQGDRCILDSVLGVHVVIVFSRMKVVYQG